MTAAGSTELFSLSALLVLLLTAGCGGSGAGALLAAACHAACAPRHGSDQHVPESSIVEGGIPASADRDHIGCTLWIGNTGLICTVLCRRQRSKVLMDMCSWMLERSPTSFKTYPMQLVLVPTVQDLNALSIRFEFQIFRL